jgi:hypothetical protein
MKNNFYSWLIAGFLTGYLSMTVEANMLKKEMPDDETYWKINFGKQYLQNPTMYAIIAVVVFYTVLNFFPPGLQKYYVIGAIMGLIIPSIKMINNYAIDVYGVTVQFLYGWDLMVYTLFHIFIIGPLLESL